MSLKIYIKVIICNFFEKKNTWFFVFNLISCVVCPHQYVWMWFINFWLVRGIPSWAQTMTGSPVPLVPETQTVLLIQQHKGHPLRWLLGHRMRVSLERCRQQSGWARSRRCLQLARRVITSLCEVQVPVNPVSSAGTGPSQQTAPYPFPRAAVKNARDWGAWHLRSCCLELQRLGVWSQGPGPRCL